MQARQAAYPRSQCRGKTIYKVWTYKSTLHVSAPHCSGGSHFSSCVSSLQNSHDSDPQYEVPIKKILLKERWQGLLFQAQKDSQLSCREVPRCSGGHPLERLEMKKGDISRCCLYLRASSANYRMWDCSIRSPWRPLLFFKVLLSAFTKWAYLAFLFATTSAFLLLTCSSCDL